MKYDPITIISDIKTYQIITNNKNYKDRLYEAYLYIKSKKINTYQKFIEHEDNLVGLFSYHEITIFDRLKNDNYKKIIEDSWNLLHQEIDRYISDPEIGDALASYGRLGYTPKREEYILKGYVFTNLTEEEQLLRDNALNSTQEGIKRSSK